MPSSKTSKSSGGEIGDEVALPVGHRDAEVDEVDAGPEDGRLLGRHGTKDTTRSTKRHETQTARVIVTHGRARTWHSSTGPD